MKSPNFPEEPHFAQESAYGTSFPDLNKAYRSAGWYFSSERAFDVTVAYQLDPRPEFKETVTGNFNYEGGCNPVNVTFVTGLGSKRQREIVHQYAQNDRATLPPSGLPLGNVQAGFPWLYWYETELGSLSYPPDGATAAPYPYYDRWADTFNTTTEFVVMDQARSLASLAFWMAQGPVKTQPWRAAQAHIAGLPATTNAEQQVTATVQVEGMDTQNARIVWEARDQEPQSGSAFTFAPKFAGAQWVEVEVQWPDGRRAFAATNFTATTSLSAPSNSYQSAPQTVSAETVALFHFDADESDATGACGAMALSGNARLDQSNLAWMANRSGGALHFSDIGDKAVISIPGNALVPPAGGQISLEGMIYVDQFVAWNRQNVRIISLIEGWNSTLELMENLYDGPTLHGGSQFSLSGATLMSALTLKQWHHLKILLDSQGYSALIDGVVIARVASAELLNWGTSGSATLELGNFSGWIDEVVIKKTASNSQTQPTQTQTPVPVSVAAPFIQRSAGALSNSLVLTLSSATTNAIIYYTLNGAPPTTACAIYSVPFIVSTSCALQAMAVKAGMTDSGISKLTIDPSIPPDRAVFLGVDSTTKGNWQGKYGGDGYHVFESAFSYPPYAELVTTSASYTWSDSGTDARVLQKPGSPVSVAACWYASAGFTADLTLKDNVAHRVALYFLDWDRVGRVETVDILDTATGALLDQQTISGFEEGKYFVWNLKGAVTFRFTTLAGPNCVNSGIFFDVIPTQTVESPIPAPLPGKNLIQAANGGKLESFTSQFNTGTWSAARLTDGITDGDGHSWASVSSPAGPQEFIYSFATLKLAKLDSIVLYNYGEAGNIYAGRDVEFYSSPDGTTWTKIGGGALTQALGPQSFSVQNALARYVKITLRSGYATAYWELGEIEVHGQLLGDNLILPSNGGRLESFTSAYDTSYWAASRLTDGEKDGDGHSWASAASPKAPQEFTYRFKDGQAAKLSSLVIYNYGQAGAIYASREIEVYTAIDGGGWILAASGVLAQSAGLQLLDMGAVPADSVKIRVKSGYSSAYWELGEIEVYGISLGQNLVSASAGAKLESFTSQLDGDGWSAARLTDGVTDGAGHSWSAVPSPSSPQEFVYSFQNQQPAELDSVVLYNNGESSGMYSTRNVEFLSSIDGTNWTPIGSAILTPSAGPQFFQLPGTVARFFKMQVTQGYSPARWELAEVKVFGKLRAVNLLSQENGGQLRSFTAQYDGGAWSAQRLTDGVMDGPGHSWASRAFPTAPQEFTYTFRDSQPAKLSSITISNYGEAGDVYAGKDVEIYSSMDGTAWTKIAGDQLPKASGPQRFDLNGALVRYLRISLRSGYSPAYWELGEIEALGAVLQPGQY